MTGGCHPLSVLQVLNERVSPAVCVTGASGAGVTCSLCYRCSRSGCHLLSVLQVLQERVQQVSHQVQELESRAQSLQITIDRMSAALAKSEDQDCSQKNKVRSESS